MLIKTLKFHEIGISTLICKLGYQRICKPRLFFWFTTGVFPQHFPTIHFQGFHLGRHSEPLVIGWKDSRGQKHDQMVMEKNLRLFQGIHKLEILELNVPGKPFIPPFIGYLKGIYRVFIGYTTSIPRENPGRCLFQNTHPRSASSPLLPEIRSKLP